MLACHPFLRGLNRDSRVAAVGIRTDGPAEFLVQGGTADQNDVIVTDACSTIVSITTFM